MMKHIAIVAATIVFGAIGLEIGGHLLTPNQGGVVTRAEAIIGRPLTPVSVAGVARRTVRRCAVGVYYC